MFPLVAGTYCTYWYTYTISWIMKLSIFTALRLLVFFSFGNLLLPKPRYLLQYVPTWNSNKLGMPRSFLLSWRKIPYLASCFACFLNLQVTQPCKGEKERGEINIVNFRNKNKHNISPMIIHMPPVFIAFLTTSDSLNSPPSANPHRLHNSHRNSVAASSLPQPKPPHQKSDTKAAAILWPLCLENLFFSQN